MRQEFDHIIIGAGSAGCVLAARLTEDGSTRVLLVEAGGADHDPLIHIPIGFGMIRDKRLHDWHYDSEPEPGLANRRIAAYRGKVLGGSSSVNVQVFTRGDRGDFERWAHAGAEGWSWADVLPYFRRLETWTEGSSATRGGEGPVKVHWSECEDPLFDAWEEAARAMGLRTGYDMNDGETEGFGRVQLNIDKGRRISSAAAYLHPARGRPNLTLWTKTHVQRLLFRGHRVIGAAVARQGKTHEVFATGEVILCAGAFNSPQILMLSGIGPATHLAQAGIQVRADLPVGEGLQDHWSVPLFFHRRSPGPFHAGMRLDRMGRAMMEGFFLRRGRATQVPVRVLGFLRSSAAQLVPDLEFLLMPTSPSAKLWFPGWRAPYMDAIGIRPALLHARSRGDVRLRSADPLAPPLIRFNAMTDRQDMDRLLDGMRLGREIAHHPALDAYRGAELMPGDEITSPAGLEQFIRKTSTPLYHPASTCAIGAVVGSDLRVKGFDNLRIVDASVMPDLVTAHINACVMMIAERASDLIRGMAPLRDHTAAVTMQ